MTNRPCAGDPPGSCPALVSGERIWCHACTERRQRALAQGIPVGIPTPLRIILEDIEAPKLMCRCGGDAEGYRHEESLLHRTWAFTTASRLA